MNLIFIYLIIQGHAISPFATFGKIFSLDSWKTQGEELIIGCVSDFENSDMAI